MTKSQVCTCSVCSGRTIIDKKTGQQTYGTVVTVSEARRHVQNDKLKRMHNGFAAAEQMESTLLSKIVEDPRKNTGGHDMLFKEDIEMSSQVDVDLEHEDCQYFYQNWNSHPSIELLLQLYRPTAMLSYSPIGSTVSNSRGPTSRPTQTQT